MSLIGYRIKAVTSTITGDLGKTIIGVILEKYRGTKCFNVDLDSRTVVNKLPVDIYIVEEDVSKIISHVACSDVVEVLGHLGSKS